MSLHAAYSQAWEKPWVKKPSVIPYPRSFSHAALGKALSFPRLGNFKAIFPCLGKPWKSLGKTRYRLGNFKAIFPGLGKPWEMPWEITLHLYTLGHFRRLGKRGHFPICCLDVTDDSIIAFAVGHTTMNIPDPFRTPKSSVVRPG